MHSQDNKHEAVSFSHESRVNNSENYNVIIKFYLYLVLLLF